MEFSPTLRQDVPPPAKPKDEPEREKYKEMPVVGDIIMVTGDYGDSYGRVTQVDNDTRDIVVENDDGRGLRIFWRNYTERWCYHRLIVTWLSKQYAQSDGVKLEKDTANLESALYLFGLANK